MKTFWKSVALFALIALLALLAVGCGKGIVSDETYYLYSYDSRTDRFIRTQTALRFGEDLKTFEYTFIEGQLTISGNVEHSEVPDAYTIYCNEEAVTLVTERYKATLIASGADDDTLALYEALVASVEPSAQYFAYEQNLFMANAIELYHEPSADSDHFEGVYTMTSTEEKVRFRGGNMYTADDNGDYTVKKGYYTVSRGIMTVTSVNEDGTDRYENGILYRKRYLMAQITVPSDGSLVDTDLEEQMKKSAFTSQISQAKSDYSGKTISVLVDRFFSVEF